MALPSAQNTSIDTISHFVGKFLTKLRLEKVNHSLYELTDDFIYRSDTVGIIIVPKGFKTDLASVPRIPFIYWIFGGLAPEEAVIHDYLYTSPHQTGTVNAGTVIILNRATADKVFRGARYSCDRIDLDQYEKVTLMNLLRNSWAYIGAWCMWAGVRCFGWSHWVD